MKRKSNDYLNNLQVGDRVMTDFIPEDAYTVRTITSIEPSDNHGSGFAVQADGGDICPHCGNRPSDPIPGTWDQGVDGTWFTPVNKRGNQVEKLEYLIETEPDADKHLYYEGGYWWVTNEWLCGSFAGRAFVDVDKDKALQQLADYLDEHIGHDSMVGNDVTKSGWPDLDKVKKYLENRRGKEE